MRRPGSARLHRPVSVCAYHFVKWSINYRPIVGGARGAYVEVRMFVLHINWRSRLTAALRELGPYAAIGLVLPGGTVLLASLWAFRHRRWFLAHARRMLTRSLS
jgi:hypothetical protein